MGKRSAQAAFGILASLATFLLPGCAGRVEYLNFENLRGDAKLNERKQSDVYPKYWIELPEIPIDRPGKYVFHVSGLPKSRYWVGLAAGPAGDDVIREAIRAHDVRCNIEIEGRLEEFVIHLQGKLEGESRSFSEDWTGTTWSWIDGSRRWIYCPNEMSASRQFQPNPAIEYEIRIRVTMREDLPWPERAGPRTLTPMLWAGGYWARFFESS